MKTKKNKTLKIKRLGETQNVFGKMMRICFDGSHYVGTEIIKKSKKKLFLKPNDLELEKRKYQDYFDEIFSLAITSVKINKMSDCNKNTELKKILQDGMLERYPDIENIEEYINFNISRKVKNYYLKEKRLKNKGYLNKWNYFVTFTYDNKKHTEMSFRLKKCLSNFAFRRKWKYMGVFETSPDKKRLHFHAIMFIPDGEMIGELRTRKDYSTKQKKLQETMYNTFFEKRFGRCDFKEITSGNRQQLIREIEYMSKYIFKTNEQINYSRGLKTDITTLVYNEDIASDYERFIRRYVLFDDCIQNNIYRPNYKQITMFELEEPPPKKVRKNSNLFKTLRFCTLQKLKVS